MEPESKEPELNTIKMDHNYLNVSSTLPKVEREHTEKLISLLAELKPG